ncbi:MAG: DUF1499 domain-containing protein [Halioglobus sp.]
MKAPCVNFIFIVLLLTGCTSSPEKPGTDAILPACGPLPNCVNSQITDGGKSIASLKASAPEWQQLKAWLAQQKGWTITADKGDFLQAVVTTSLMRFRDDVQLLFTANEGLIHVRSSSRLGIGDMGTNRRRVEMLRSELATGFE